MPSTCECGCGLQVGYSGNYRKGHQPAGTSCDPDGKQRVSNQHHNPINAPINGPIQRAKLKRERRADAEAYLLEHDRTGILSNDVRVLIAERIAEDRSLFDDHDDERLRGKSLDDLFTDPSFSCYIGETMRTLEFEALRWLTERGSRLTRCGRNRPVLRWATGDLIRESEAKEQLGFRSVFVWKNDEKPNTTFVEDQLQQRYHDLGLPRRLHRQIAMGSNGFDEREEVAFELHKVFIAYSFDVQSAIDAGEVIAI